MRACSTKTKRTEALETGQLSDCVWLCPCECYSVTCEIEVQVVIALGQGGAVDMSAGDELADELAGYFTDDDLGADSASDGAEGPSDRRGGQKPEQDLTQTQQDELVSMKQFDWDESFKTSL